MGKMNFYVLWSLRDAPRQFMSKSKGRHFQVHVPLPLPQQLIIFGLGEWRCGQTTIAVEVVVSEEVKAQRIGTLSAQARCLTWEGDWSSELVSMAAERSRKGVYGKILLTVCGEPQDSLSILSSTPRPKGKYGPVDHCPTTELCSSLHHSAVNAMMTLNSTRLDDTSSYVDLPTDKTESYFSAAGSKAPAWPTEKTPQRTVISKRGRLEWSSEDVSVLGEEGDKAPSTKKRIVCRMNSRDQVTMQVQAEDTAVSGSPSVRWSHSMCLVDPDTAILIGGEGAEQQQCPDWLWRLELDSESWFPVNPPPSELVLPSARGRSATFDPDSKAVFVYGGLSEAHRYKELHILDTLTWKWRLVTTKGNVPTLAHHSAVFYKRELFIFGGVQPSHAPAGEKSCSNALYIFNPEFEVWYQPIVEGDRPLPRFGHSASLLAHKLLIFGGRTSATYLNDVHVLDLGLMEYTAVKSGNMPPLPRGFHAAATVSDNKVLVCGGCSSIGSLQDVHIFNTDSSMWTSLVAPLLCSKPCAGHSLVMIDSSARTHAQESEQGGVRCTLLVFGGSDCSGVFYNDTIKCAVEIPADK